MKGSYQGRSYRPGRLTSGERRHRSGPAPLFYCGVAGEEEEKAGGASRRRGVPGSRSPPGPWASRGRRLRHLPGPRRLSRRRPLGVRTPAAPRARARRGRGRGGFQSWRPGAPGQVLPAARAAPRGHGRRGRPAPPHLGPPRDAGFYAETDRRVLDAPKATERQRCGQGAAWYRAQPGGRRGGSSLSREAPPG